MGGESVHRGAVRHAHTQQAPALFGRGRVGVTTGAAARPHSDRHHDEEALLPAAHYEGGRYLRRAGESQAQLLSHSGQRRKQPAFGHRPPQNHLLPAEAQSIRQRRAGLPRPAHHPPRSVVHPRVHLPALPRPRPALTVGPRPQLLAGPAPLPGRLALCDQRALICATRLPPLPHHRAAPSARNQHEKPASGHRDKGRSRVSAFHGGLVLPPGGPAEAAEEGSGGVQPKLLRRYRHIRGRFAKA
mmetsp:Transcript_33551/g.73939  ORF Transcript_33551/g.73939 Transcript_33551/m.73939 type:complete len:244 (+) Transcript_33551:1840-2571(+)